jgi:hypothetical protein
MINKNKVDKVIISLLVTRNSYHVVVRILVI